MLSNPLQIHLKLPREIQEIAETTEILIVHKTNKKVQRIHQRKIQICLYKKNHCAKNLISQVLKYHEKLKKTK